MSDLKFSAEYMLEKVDGKMEFSGGCIIGERPWIAEAIDYTTLEDELENYEYLTELPDGLYHVFTTGITNWWIDHTPDGDEQDYSIECEYINAYRLEGHEKAYAQAVNHD
jgi:hypothetical protein